MRTFIWESGHHKVTIEIDLHRKIPVKLVVRSFMYNEDVVVAKEFTLLRAENLASCYVRDKVITKEVIL